MHFHIGFMEFVVFAMYYIILKAILLVIHLEAKRNKLTRVTALTGMLG